MLELKLDLGLKESKNKNQTHKKLLEENVLVLV